MNKKIIKLLISFDRNLYENIVFENNDCSNSFSSLDLVFEIYGIKKYTYKEIKRTNFEYVYEFEFSISQEEHLRDDLIESIETVDFVNYVKDI